jgi:hypothetical protein
VVASFEGATGTKNIFVNGQLVASAVSGLRTVSGIPLRIGCGNPALTPNEFIDGTVDEVAIYRKVLTPSQVATHYAIGSGMTPPAPPVLTITTSASNLVLTWPNNWVLQSKPVMDGNPNTWADILGATSPYTVAPTNNESYFRLRSP